MENEDKGKEKPKEDIEIKPDPDLRSIITKAKKEKATTLKNKK